MDIGGILSSIYYFSKLSIQSLNFIAKAKYQHRRAQAAFKRTLILHGVSSEAADEIAEAYPNPINEILSLVNIKDEHHKGESNAASTYDG